MKKKKQLNFIIILILLIFAFFFTSSNISEARKVAVADPDYVERLSKHVDEANAWDKLEEEARLKMLDCVTVEENKCYPISSECEKPCRFQEDGCYAKCNSEMIKCINYARRADEWYEKCSKKSADLGDSIWNSISQDYSETDASRDASCKPEKLFVSCMNEFQGLCKVAWPQAPECPDGPNVNNQSQDNNSKDQNDYDNLNKDLLGQPFSLTFNISPCIGPTPRNSELCPGDDKNVLYYTEKQLVDVCSIPQGSEPKCEYVCKTEHLDDGTCREYGIFRRFFGFLYNLFWGKWR